MPQMTDNQTTVYKVLALFSQLAETGKSEDVSAEVLYIHAKNTDEALNRFYKWVSEWEHVYKIEMDGKECHVKFLSIEPLAGFILGSEED